MNLLEPGPGPVSVGCARAASLFAAPVPLFPPLCPRLPCPRPRALARSGPGQTWRGLAYSEQRAANTLFWPCTSGSQWVVCHPSPSPVPLQTCETQTHCQTPLRARGNTVFGKCYSGMHACMYIYIHPYTELVMRPYTLPCTRAAFLTYGEVYGIARAQDVGIA